MKFKAKALQLVGASTLTLAVTTPVFAQENDESVPAEEVSSNVIVVTAQKREQSVNDVPMSITAATGDTLAERGVVEVADLINVVPGFSTQSNNYGQPNFSLRGIGNQSDSVLSTPAVSVYVDQAPLAYSIMAQGLTFDLERVEVLKGPQGTLFGQNSTGGAINFVPNKPGDSLEVGGRVTYGRFNTFNLEGFVSAPLTDTLGVRLSGVYESSDGWQKSVTRPNDRLGSRDFLAGRLIAQWEPSASVRITANINAWRNKSELPAAQYVPGTFVPVAGFDPQTGNFNFMAAPALALLVPLYQQVENTYANVDLTSNRLADWTPGEDYVDDTDQFQAVLTAEVDISDAITLTSVTNYVSTNGFQVIDGDGLAEQIFTQRTPIDISSFSQELRLNGEIGDRMRWMVGGSYQNDDGESGSLISTNFSNNIAPFFTPAEFFNGLPPLSNPLSDFGSRVVGVPGIGSLEFQDLTTIGIFGSVDYEITDTLEFSASARWTESDNDWRGCFNDLGNGILSTFVNGLPPFPNAQPGGCVTLLDSGNFGAPPFVPGGMPDAAQLAAFVPGTVGFVEEELKEDNVSWRVGLNWDPTGDTLLYANVTRGYKAGNFPRIPALLREQQLPNGQEKVTAYEAGVKQTFVTGQVNAAAFYYKYSDKQALGTFLSPVLGIVPAGVSIPSADVFGFEIDGVWEPVDNLTATGAVGYIDSEVISSQLNSPVSGFQDAIDPIRVAPIDISGLALPNTSKWTVTADLEYRIPISFSTEAYVGASGFYRSSFTPLLSDSPLLRVDGYTTFDLRAGINFEDTGVRVEIWGRNITDEFYLSSVNKLADAVTRFTGRPATFGVTVSFRN